jgi:hypothetical protein
MIRASKRSAEWNHAMRHCAKCSLTFPDSMKICRSCGAILDDFVDARPPHVPKQGTSRDQLESIADEVLSAVDGPVLNQADEQYSWTCSQCAEEVPGSFDICWNCGIDRDAVVASRGVEVRAGSEPQQSLTLTAGATGASALALRCNLCGSTKIVPSVRIVDQGERSSGKLELVVFGSPDAIIFKDRRWGEITADICGECGHLELRVQNAKELYDHYLISIDHPNV